MSLLSRWKINPDHRFRLYEQRPGEESKLFDSFQEVLILELEDTDPPQPDYRLLYRFLDTCTGENFEYVVRPGQIICAVRDDDDRLDIWIEPAEYGRFRQLQQEFVMPALWVSVHP